MEIFDTNEQYPVERIFWRFKQNGDFIFLEVYVANEEYNEAINVLSGISTEMKINRYRIETAYKYVETYEINKELYQPLFMLDKKLYDQFYIKVRSSFYKLIGTGYYYYGRKYKETLSREDLKALINSTNKVLRDPEKYKVKSKNLID